MGASGWEYVVPYQDDLAAALDALRRQVFAAGNYMSPADYGYPAPGSVDDIVQETYWEFMGTCGTHSIIDVLNVAPVDDTEQHSGTIRPLTGAEYEALFGAASPSRAQYNAVSNTAMLYDFVTGGRWTGRSAVLWTAGEPSEIAFWGYSGD